MRIAGSAGSEDRKKFIAMCVFAMLAVSVLYYELRDPTPAAPPPPPVITTSPAQAAIAPSSSSTSSPAHGARKIGTTDAALDPTLHTEPMRRTESVAYEGSGRNIFSGAASEVAIPKPIQPARPKPVVAQGPPPPPPGPPPPPPIDLRFSGYFLSPATGERQIILIQGDDVILAHQGDVVLRRYKILSVSANSIQVEDMPNNNRQVLPLVVN